MDKRVINILNSDNQRRTFKFLADYEGIIVHGIDDNFKITRYKGGNVKGIEFSNGPTIYIDDTVYFKKRGGFRIIDIMEYPLHNYSNCYFLDVIRISHGEKQEN